MAQAVLDTNVRGPDRDRSPVLTGETRRHLGDTLRAVYEGTFDMQPLPDSQIDLLLRLRHKERDLRRAS